MIYLQILFIFLTIAYGMVVLNGLLRGAKVSTSQNFLFSAGVTGIIATFYLL